MGWFNGWFGTRWYAMLYSHRNEEDAKALVGPLIAKGNLQPGQRILDMGCGRGRHAAIFARNNMQVTGIDISPESIAIAREAVPEATFVVHDIREPFATNMFDAVVCLFTSLGYSDDRRDDHRAIEAAAQALKPGGLFVVDVLNGEYVSRNLVAAETKVIDGVRFDISRMRQGDDIVKQIRVGHAGGKEEYEERVHAWTLPEMDALIQRAGLRLEDTTDGTCLAPFNPEQSERMMAWSRKAP